MERETKESKSTAVGWVRMQRNRKTNEYFYIVSLVDGTKGILRMDKKSIDAVKQDAALLGKKVVGTVLVNKGEGGLLEKSVGTTNGSTTAPQTFTPKATTPVAKAAAADDDMPF